jgi:hypothetical protein
MDLTNEWVSQEFENLAHVLYDYDHNLRLEMVPVADWPNLIDKSKVFRVIDINRNVIVMHFSSLVSPSDILANIWSMDQNHNDVVANMDTKNAAIRALEMKKNLDEIEAQKDFAMFVAKNQKSRWVHNGRVKDEHFRDKGPVRKTIL